MPIYEGIKREYGTRSNTHLVKSGHQSPACDWVLSKKFKDSSVADVYPDGVLFKYVYGGVGHEDVVIPKGRLVGVGAPEKNFHDQQFKTVLTLPGFTTNGNVVGMAPYNFCKDMLEEDRFGGNKPSVITSELVDLPYMPGVAATSSTGEAGVKDEEKRISQGLNMPWGAVLGTVECGDYIKATPSGRCTKWDPLTDKEYQRVGQVYEMDLNQESFGWLKWMLWDESARLVDDNMINRTGTTLPTDYGYPFDSSYREGYLALIDSYQSQYTSNPTGVPGLHDGSGDMPGYGRNDSEFKDIELLTSTPSSVTSETLIVVNAKDLAGNNAKNLVPGSVTIKVGDRTVNAEDLTINYEKGEITIKLQSTDNSKKVTGTYKMKFYGTSSYLDFKGVVGQVTVLLQK